MELIDGAGFLFSTEMSSLMTSELLNKNIGEDLLILGHHAESWLVCTIYHGLRTTAGDHKNKPDECDSDDPSTF